MNNNRNRSKTGLSYLVMALLLLAVMITGAGCGKSADASAFVKSFMDMLTKGELEEYVKLSGQSEEEAKEEYDAITSSISQELASYGASEEVQNRYVEVHKAIWAKSKYEVGEAKKIKEDEYEVPVTIEPITGLFDGLSEELEQEANEYGNQIAADGENADQINPVDWIFNALLDKIEERLDLIEYGDPQTITVKVEKENGVYEIEDSEETGSRIGAALIDSTGLTQ